MKTKLALFISSIILIVFFLAIAYPLSGVGTAHAAPNAQFVTSTPGPDGRILYTVVAGDTCDGVAIKVGITRAQIRQLNSHLNQDCTLIVGQQLVIGLVSNAPTAGPIPT